MRHSDARASGQCACRSQTDPISRAPATIPSHATDDVTCMASCSTWCHRWGLTRRHMERWRMSPGSRRHLRVQLMELQRSRSASLAERILHIIPRNTTLGNRHKRVCLFTRTRAPHRGAPPCTAQTHTVSRVRIRRVLARTRSRVTAVNWSQNPGAYNRV